MPEQRLKMVQSVYIMFLYTFHIRSVCLLQGCLFRVTGIQLLNGEADVFAAACQGSHFSSTADAAAVLPSFSWAWPLPLLAQFVSLWGELNRGTHLAAKNHLQNGAVYFILFFIFVIFFNQVSHSYKCLLAQWELLQGWELVARAGNDSTIELLAKYLSLTRNTS